MPNWCENDGTIKHKDVKKIKALYKAIQKNKFCEHVKPLPNGEWDYNWCIENWDTKWELDFFDYGIDGNTIHFSALSAWSPPDGVYHKLIEEGCEIDVDYFEGGVDFCGILTNEKDLFLENTFEKYKTDQLPMWALKRWDFDEIYAFLDEEDEEVAQ